VNPLAFNSATIARSLFMIDHSGMKLGRKAIKTDTRTLKMARYLGAELPPPPASVDWTKGISNWGMMLNDTLGDCTIAGVGHAIQVWTANTRKKMQTVSNATVESLYEKWDGYDPSNPATDRGGIELDVLNDWRHDGLTGHKLFAFAAPNPSNLVEIRQSIALFGGVYIGLSLPVTAQTQDVWDVVPHGGAKARAGSWGGHCVFVPQYDEKTFTCITWGQLKKMTVAFWNRYCDEAYTLFGQNWLKGMECPAGFKKAELEADLGNIH